MMAFERQVFCHTTRFSVWPGSRRHVWVYDQLDSCGVAYLYMGHIRIP